MNPNNLSRRSLVLLSAAAASTLATGCAPLVVGGAIVGSAMMATDRRTAGTQIEDEGIELRSGSRIRENLGERVHVNVTSYNRQVLLTGEVPTAQDRALVEQVVSRVENVRSIVNDLGVLGISTLTQRSSDVLVTGQARAALVDARDLVSSAFKVITERGTVYLMGRVTEREAERATQIVRGVRGVQKVVRVFELISEDELRKLQPPTKPAS